MYTYKNTFQYIYIYIHICIYIQVCAGVTGSLTLYSANYMRSDDLYKAAVQELSRRDGLRSLQLMMMMFGVIQP